MLATLLYVRARESAAQCSVTFDIGGKGVSVSCVSSSFFLLAPFFEIMFSSGQGSGCTVVVKRVVVGRTGKKRKEGR